MPNANTTAPLPAHADAFLSCDPEVGAFDWSQLPSAHVRQAFASLANNMGLRSRHGGVACCFYRDDVDTLPSRFKPHCAAPCETAVASNRRWDSGWTNPRGEGPWCE